MISHSPALAPQPQGKRTEWRALELHCKKLKTVHLRELFSQDPLRGERMNAEGASIYLDYSKNRITHHTLKLLIQLAEASALQARIDSMFRGENVNITEKRAALHVALRSPKGSCIHVEGKNVVQQVHAVLDRMTRFCERVRTGEWTGFTGKRIRNIINIGTGGSHLGPLMAYRALRHYSEERLAFRFISNVNSTDFVEAVRDLDPSETLFVICSKTFTTLETLRNAQTAKRWLLDGLGGDEKALTKHFVAASTNAKEATRFGIDLPNLFEFWDWVGSRYSLCSSIGLSTMLAIGPRNFQKMLDGFHEMDMHYLATPLERNLPVLLGLLSIWNNDFLGAESLAIVPYEQYLEFFPDYLQQLIMESNGKHVTLIGTEVTQPTSPICWGDPGTNSQHSLFQFIQQSTRLVPCDFILFSQPIHQLELHHDILMANAFTHSRTLAFGNTPEYLRDLGTPDWLVPHCECYGNRPSNTVLVERLTPETLGKLIALYEHSVYTQGVIWNINPFDQWAVELSRSSAQQIIPSLENKEDAPLDYDSSTNALIRKHRLLRNGVVEASTSSSET